MGLDECEEVRWRRAVGPCLHHGMVPRSSASDSTNRDHHVEPYPPAKEMRVTFLATICFLQAVTLGVSNLSSKLDLKGIGKEEKQGLMQTLNKFYWGHAHLYRACELSWGSAIVWEPWIGSGKTTTPLCYLQFYLCKVFYGVHIY